MNDVFYIISVVSVFILIGIALPFVSSAFGGSTADYNTNQTMDEIGQDSYIPEGESLTSVQTKTGIFNIIFSIAKVFVFTFGELPFWLDTLLFIPRIALYLLLYRQIRSGAG